MEKQTIGERWRFWKAVKWVVEEAKSLVSRVRELERQICTAEPEKGLGSGATRNSVGCFAEAAMYETSGWQHGRELSKSRVLGMSTVELR